MSEDLNRAEEEEVIQPVVPAVAEKQQTPLVQVEGDQELPVPAIIEQEAVVATSIDVQDGGTGGVTAPTIKPEEDVNANRS